MNLLLFELRTERHTGLVKELRSAGLTVTMLPEDVFDAEGPTLALRLGTGAGLLLADSDAAPRQIAAIRRAGYTEPVIVMRDVRNARRAAELLDTGADDDMVIPVKGPEVRARLRSIARRSAGHASAQTSIGEITVFFDGRDPEVQGERVQLSSRESVIFQHLAMNTSRIVSKQTLYDVVYGLSDDRPFDKVIDVHICKIRKKLSAASAIGHSYIETVRRRGYTLAAPE
ncbi:Cell cycle transcriptional regulator CtrA [Roseivivax marinus]|uniref:Cell cycle transcriptional regulator CtrA n=1 Tax=Roseivivax marinus TaxID=1379903 RepID=W4HFD7_9RHOB|nr:response regulator transcription factor [Roseivivax marinus]ETW11467.1 Cell cycle transcriptional regulator CtrA [Roseivivax marinus]